MISRFNIIFQFELLYVDIIIAVNMNIRHFCLRCLLISFLLCLRVCFIQWFSRRSVSSVPARPSWQILRFYPKRPNSPSSTPRNTPLPLRLKQSSFRGFDQLDLYPGISISHNILRSLEDTIRLNTPCAVLRSVRWKTNASFCVFGLRGFISYHCLCWRGNAVTNCRYVNYMIAFN